MKMAFGFICITVLILAAPAPGALAQSGCATGIVTLPAGINGNIKICGPVAAQAPDLAPELTQILSAMSSQQAELDQLTRLVKDINQMSGPLGAKRQAELLTNVIARLGSSNTVSGTQLQQRASTLSGHFEEVSTQIDAAQSDPAGAAKTKAALQGSTGDAIARLDFDTVENQLSDIQATVHAVDSRTKDIQGTVDAIRHDQQTQQQVQQEEAEQAQKRSLADPEQFVTMYISGAVTPAGSGKVNMMLSHQTSPALTDAKMQIVFTAHGQQPWEVDPQIPHVIDAYGGASADISKIANHAVVCLSAFDGRVNERRRWRKAFVIQSQSLFQSPSVAALPKIPNVPDPNNTYGTSLLANVPSVRLTFQADSDATLTPDSDAPCESAQEQAQAQREVDQMSAQMVQQNQKDAQDPSQQPQDPVKQFQDQITQRNQQFILDAQKRAQSDPNSFVGINFIASGIAGGPGTLLIGGWRVTHQPSLTESKMQIAFSLRQQHWVVNVPIAPLIDTSGFSLRLDPPRIGDHAVLCFSARDPSDGQRRRWRKEFVLMGQSANENGRFQPASDPTLTPDSDAPCQ